MDSSNKIVRFGVELPAPLLLFLLISSSVVMLVLSRSRRLGRPVRGYPGLSPLLKSVSSINNLDKVINKSNSNLRLRHDLVPHPRRRRPPRPRVRLPVALPHHRLPLALAGVLHGTFSGLGFATYLKVLMVYYEQRNDITGEWRFLQKLAKVRAPFNG